MSLREWFGLAPTLDGFASDLLKQFARAGRGGWKYESANAQLTHTAGGEINLHNIFLEYSRAPRVERSGLLDKYVSLVFAQGAEIPKLWEVAAKSIYPVVRSRFDHVLLRLQMQARGDKGNVPDPVTWPLAGGLEVKLVFDFGDAMAPVYPETVDTWGQSRDAVFERGVLNLRALEAPRWEQFADGAYQLVSNVSYEESFALVDRVAAALPFASPVFLPSNRGVLLACNPSIAGALKAMLERASECIQERPWPIGATLLERVDGKLAAYMPFDAEAAYLSGNLQRINLSGLYAEQKAALERIAEASGDDRYFASFGMLQRERDGKRIMSWCSWADGVRASLPRTDLVALGRPESKGKEPSIMVEWGKLAAICGNRLTATTDDPERYLVETFPDTTEWAAIVSAGEQLGT